MDVAGLTLSQSSLGFSFLRFTQLATTVLFTLKRSMGAIPGKITQRFPFATTGAYFSFNPVFLF
jgi:hypothetical protein